MTDQQIDMMLQDEESVSIADDVCCHVKALAGYVEELQRSIAEMENANKHLELLLMRKTEALAIFATGHQWLYDGKRHVWNGANEYSDPVSFAMRERDATEPDDR